VSPWSCPMPACIFVPDRFSASSLRPLYLGLIALIWFLAAGLSAVCNWIRLLGDRHSQMLFQRIPEDFTDVGRSFELDRGRLLTDFSGLMLR